jgi:membrane-bound metal-dependent hydrolase YbcI (DUF457 family)
MAQPIQLGGHPNTFASTTRKDDWWVGPVATAVGLVVFFGYLTYRAMDAKYVWADPYISPTVAPTLFTPAAGYPGAVPVEHAWFGAFPEWWPPFLPQSPAFFLPGLAILFRFTCYYYRKAYYRAFASSPPGCAVRGHARPYRGETSVLLFQNLHRYALYGALLLLVFLWAEGLGAFFKDGKFGVGVGTIVMVINATLLSGYTFGCHSFRHLIGGKIDHYSCTQLGEERHGAWKAVSVLNKNHQSFAWASLFSVGFADLYVRLVSMGIWHDLRFF